MEREFYGTEGTAIAPAGSMVRRITALLGVVAILGLITLLVWKVYEHHESHVPRDEPTIVEAAAPLRGVCG